MFLFSVWERNPINLTEFLELHDVSDIVGEAPHGLQTLKILVRVFVGEPMDHVPILGSRDDHVVDQIVLVEPFEGSGIASPSAGDDGGADKPPHMAAMAIEKAVEEGSDSSRGARIIDGAPCDDGAIDFAHLRSDLVDEIVLHAAMVLVAKAARDAIGHRLIAQENDVGIDPVRLQLGLDFKKGPIGAAMLMAGAVDQDDFLHLSNRGCNWARRPRC